MKGRIISYIMSGLLLAATAGQASALTFYLDQAIGGGPPITSAPSYGTITLTQVDKGVQIDVNLTNSTAKLLEFALNYNEDKFSNADIFSLTNGVSVAVGENSIKQDGYQGRLDIAMPDNTNLNSNSFSAVLTDSNKLLTPEDFNFTDTLNLLYATAHLGNINPAGDSIWVGSDGQLPAVPEPGTMMLVGAGFLGLAVYGKRRKNA